MTWIEKKMTSLSVPQRALCLGVEYELGTISTRRRRGRRDAVSLSSLLVVVTTSNWLLTRDHSSDISIA